MGCGTEWDKRGLGMVHLIEASRFGDGIWHRLDSDLVILDQENVSFCILLFHPSALLYSCAFFYFTAVRYLLFGFYYICVGAYW